MKRGYDATRSWSLSAPLPRIVLFGDSITQGSFSCSGWGAALQDRYQRRADVLNRGFSGYNTRWARELLTLVRDSANATVLVTIFFGANDASLPEHNLRQHVPLEEYMANIRIMVADIRAHCPRAEILIISPPPVCESQRLEYQRHKFGSQATSVLERTNENTGRYAAAAERVAKEMSVPCLNLWAELQAIAPDDGWHDFLSDGLHLSAAGSSAVGRLLIAKIDESFPALAVHGDTSGSFGNSGSRCEQLAHIGPWHDQIDPNEHWTSFMVPASEGSIAGRVAEEDRAQTATGISVGDTGGPCRAKQKSGLVDSHGGGYMD